MNLLHFSPFWGFVQGFLMLAAQYSAHLRHTDTLCRSLSFPECVIASFFYANLLNISVPFLQPDHCFIAPKSLFVFSTSSGWFCISEELLSELDASMCFQFPRRLAIILRAQLCAILRFNGVIINLTCILNLRTPTGGADWGTLHIKVNETSKSDQD